MATDRQIVELDITTLKLMCPADLHEMEQRTGKPFGQLMAVARDVTMLDATSLQALAFLQLRRDDPDVTWEAAGQCYISFEVEELDPTGLPLPGLEKPNGSDGPTSP